MTRVLLWAPAALFAIFLVVVASGIVKPKDDIVHSHMIGQDLPSFSLPPIAAGKPGLASTDLRGKGPHLLNVFASWCAPCEAEVPMLMALKQRGVAIDAIALRDEPGDVRRFLDAHGDPYARIGDDRDASVQLSLGSSGVPESFVVDGQGRIVLQHVGAIDRNDMPAILQALEQAK